MKRLRFPTRRTLATVCLTLIAAGGVAYAVVFSNPAVVDGSSIHTSSANLTVSTDGTHYGTHVTGFDFSNIMPGSPLQPVDGKTIFLRNNGSAPLNLRLKLDPLAANAATNIDTSRVYLALTRVGTTEIQQYPISTLASGQPTQLLYKLSAGQDASYRLQVRVDEGAVSDTSVEAVVSGLTLVFDGQAESV